MVDASKRKAKLAYQKEWYRKNAEQRKIKNAEYYAANKDRAKELAREWVAANKERVRKNQKRWRAANKDKLLKANTKYRLKKFYGLTPDAWETMFEGQGRVCKCCGSDDPKVKNGWHVDHCHETGAVRGILCQQCNIRLGCAADNPSTLMKGAQYLLLA